MYVGKNSPMIKSLKCFPQFQINILSELDHHGFDTLNLIVVLSNSFTLRGSNLWWIFLIYAVYEN